MQKKALTFPEIALIAGTRVALGMGLGLLVSGRLNRDQRRSAGVALLAVGALSSIPLIKGIFAKPPVRDTWETAHEPDATVPSWDPTEFVTPD